VDLCEQCLRAREAGFSEEISLGYSGARPHTPAFLRLFLAKVVFRLPDAGKPLRLLRAHRERPRSR
jgi:hypothetical protein